MDELLKQFLANAPYAALLILMLRQVYEDQKIERLANSQERLLMQTKLDRLEECVNDHQASVDGFVRAVQNGGKSPASGEP